MKITNVEGFVLQSNEKYSNPVGAEEAPGVAYCFLIKVSTDAGITGWADVETAPHIAQAVIAAPATGSDMIEGLRELVVGEDPFETKRLWDKVYRGMIYYGRRGVAIQVLSGFDIALHDIIGKATGQPVYKLLGVPIETACAHMPRRCSVAVWMTCAEHAGTTWSAASRRSSLAGAYSARIGAAISNWSKLPGEKLDRMLRLW